MKKIIKNIIMLFLLSMGLYGCGGSKHNVIIINQEENHIHTLTFDGIDKDAIFDRYVKWIGNNSFKFYKNEIIYPLKEPGLIGANFIKEFDIKDYAAWQQLKYVGFKLGAEIKDEQVIFIFSDLFFMDASFNKYSTGSDGKSTEKVDKTIYSKMLAELETYIITYRDN